MTEQKARAFATVAIHAGEQHDAQGSHVSPIYQTSTYVFPNMEAVEKYASGEAGGYLYSRGGNPSRTALAAKLAALEGHKFVQQAKASGQDGGSGSADKVVAAEIFSSGMAAITAALLGLAQAGDHIIAQDVLYGSSNHLLAELLPQYGISTSRAEGLQADVLAQELEKHPNTTVVFLETPANPTMLLVDIEAVADVAQAYGARVVVDNTFATPVLQRPLELGADVVVHSTTKYISGHGAILGGAVVSHHVALIEEKIGPLIRYMGGVPSPFDCWLTNLGLKTLPLRMRQHCLNGMEVAIFLQLHDRIAAVHYPGLASFPQHELAKKRMDDFGAMIAFEVKGGAEACVRLLDKVKLCGLAVSLGNIDTLIEHPASMTHSGMSPEARAKAGIRDGLIRLSVGLEAAEDIIADFDQALGD